MIVVATLACGTAVLAYAPPEDRQVTQRVVTVTLWLESEDPKGGEERERRVRRCLPQDWKYYVLPGAAGLGLPNIDIAYNEGAEWAAQEARRRLSREFGGRITSSQYVKPVPDGPARMVTDLAIIFPAPAMERRGGFWAAYVVSLKSVATSPLMF